MLKDNFNDLLSFMVVARERSFTRAAPRRSLGYLSRHSATQCASWKRGWKSVC